MFAFIVVFERFKKMYDMRRKQQPVPHQCHLVKLSSLKKRKERKRRQAPQNMWNEN